MREQRQTAGGAVFHGVRLSWGSALAGPGCATLRLMRCPPLAWWCVSHVSLTLLGGSIGTCRQRPPSIIGRVIVKCGPIAGVGWPNLCIPVYASDWSITSVTRVPRSTAPLGREHAKGSGHPHCTVHLSGRQIPPTYGYFPPASDTRINGAHGR